MKNQLLSRAAAAACALSVPLSALADTPSTALPAVLLTGNPLRSEPRALPAAVLDGEALLLRRGSSLGETLEGLPGVSSSYFGPNANRPVLRGLDGDRIRVLSNAGASLDASSLSFDHALPLDPLMVERIEVLRGPQALLYGGSALGGVVNAIDGRIPSRASEGLAGAAELRLGGADGERAAAALVEGGGKAWAWHADAFARRTTDLRVPDYLRPDEAGGSALQGRVLNSASRAQGGALGVSRVGAQGFLGLAWDHYANDYGTVAEEGVQIEMRRDKLALAGEWRDATGFTLRAQAAHTRYQHLELEGGEVGTTFKNRGHDARLELVHPRLALGGGQLEGVAGAQVEQARFEALGEEAFVPGTRTRQRALFLLEQWTLGALQASAGLRAERVNVASAGDVAEVEAPRFGAAQQRHFQPGSRSLGLGWGLAAGWQLKLSSAWSERAPTQYELYADGVHAATAAYERGDTLQKLERGRQLELGLDWQRGDAQFKASAFDARFDNYIALLRSDAPDFEDEEGGSVPVYEFRGVRARLHGIELSAQQAWTQGVQRWKLEAGFDTVRGRNLSRNEALPRLAPWRASLGLQWQTGPWTLSALATHAARQSRVSADDRPTAAWSRVDLALLHRLQWAGSPGQEAHFFLKVHNLGNRLAYSASSAPTLRSLAPLPGRSLKLGLRWLF